VFGGRRTFSYKVDVALLNENEKRIGNGSISLNTEAIGFNSGDISITHPFDVHEIVRFPNIKTEDLTPSLTIVIVAVNGISSRNLASSGFMRVEIADLEKIRKERAQAFFEKGGSYFQLDYQPPSDYQQAIADYQKLIADNQRAIVDYTQAIQLDPNYSWAYNNQGISFFLLKNFNEAILNFNEAIRLNPNVEVYYYYRGSAYTWTENYYSALSDYNDAIRLNSNYIYAYTGRGFIYEKLKDYRRAQTDYESAFRQDPNNTAIRDDLNRVRNIR